LGATGHDARTVEEGTRRSTEEKTLKGVVDKLLAHAIAIGDAYALLERASWEGEHPARLPQVPGSGPVGGTSFNSSCILGSLFGTVRSVDEPAGGAVLRGEPACS
jgi:hypothetical protein